VSVEKVLNEPGGPDVKVNKLELLRLYEVKKRAEKALRRLQAEPTDPGRTMDVVVKILGG
jgi:hypothetical protein